MRVFDGSVKNSSLALAHHAEAHFIGLIRIDGNKKPRVTAGPHHLPLHAAITVQTNNTDARSNGY
jgi:hypothetical protein